MEENNLDNLSNQEYPSSMSIDLPGQLKPIISTSLIFDLINSHPLDVLLPDNNIKTVYN